MGSLRDDLEAAAADARAEETPLATPEAPDVDAAQAVETSESATSRGRDERGQFATPSTAKPTPPPGKRETPVTKVSQTPAPPGPAEATQPGAEQTPADPPTPKPAEKAPASWKPAAREKWSALPPEARAEVLRVDREVREVMQRTAADRQYREQVHAIISPFEGMIRAEGGEPLKVVGNLLQTAAALRTAPPAHKAQLVASIIKTYGVSVEELASALDGAGGQPQAHQQPGYQDPRVDQMFQALQAQASQRAQAQAAEAQRAVQELETSAEFLEPLEYGQQAAHGSVRGLMAELLLAANQQGIALSMQDAYTRACWVHPEVSKVMQQRAAAAQAEKAKASTQRAKAAGSSVRSQPAAPVETPSRGKSLRADLEAAKESLTQR